MIMTGKGDSFFNMQFITSSISTMLVLLLLGMVVFFTLSANNLSDYVRENIGFTILVSDDMKEADALKFQKTLNEKTYVKESMYISKEQALKEQTEAMGTDPAEFLGYNPFTASIEIKLNAEYANSDSIAWIEKEIKANKKVIEVNYPGTCFVASAHLLCIDQQHNTPGYPLQALPHPHHEISRSQLEFHPSAIPDTQCLDRSAVGRHCRHLPDRDGHVVGEIRTSAH